MTETWVFGYGSLVNPSSLSATIGRDAIPGANFLEAELSGWGRRWNYGVGHVVGSWTIDGRRVDDGVIVALGLVPSADESVNGIVARVSADELERLDMRERDYDRVDVTALVISDLPHGDAVVTYVPRASAVERYERARDDGAAGIRRSYWDLVDEAFAALGADRQERYRATTPHPDVPIVDVIAS